MPRKIFILIAFLVLLVSACAAQPTQIPATPTIEPLPTHTPPPTRLPLTEAEIPRVSVKDAKAALENGTAVIVDVRSPASFEMSHVAGAISIPLADIEAKPNDLKLTKTQWIITYCT